jgi:hypothetical protein
VQFGGQFHTRGTGADDRHVQLAGTERFGLGIRAQAGIEQTRSEALRLARGVQRDGVLSRTRRAEIVGVAAHGHDEGVVGQAALGQNLGSGFGIDQGRQQDGLARAIQPLHAAELEIEVVPARLREVVEFMIVLIHAPGSHLVQQGLPEVGARPVDQRDAGLALAPEAIAQAGGEFQTAGTAADHDDAMQAARAGRLPY